MITSEAYRSVIGRPLMLCMWVHHVISLIVWPYCILVDRAGVFVLQLLTTEASNIGQNAYQLYGALPHRNAAVHTGIGVLWIVLFAVSRIFVIPVVGFAYYGLLLQPGCGFSAFERAVAWSITLSPSAASAHGGESALASCPSAPDKFRPIV